MDRAAYVTAWNAKSDKLCQICGEPAKNIDHNHKTGEFRGFLCIRCNAALGWIERFSDRVQTYLNRSIPQA